MNNKVTAGLASMVLLVIMLGSIVSVEWGSETMSSIAFGDVALVLFELFGAALLVLAFVMFSSLLGGTFLSKEEGEE